MSDLPHGNLGHVGYMCDQCEKEATVLEFLADARPITDDQGQTVGLTNMQQNRVKAKDNTYISVDAAKEMNRAERRKRGIGL